MEPRPESFAGDFLRHFAPMRRELAGRLLDVGAIAVLEVDDDDGLVISGKIADPRRNRRPYDVYL